MVALNTLLESPADTRGLIMICTQLGKSNLIALILSSLVMFPVFAKEQSSKLPLDDLQRFTTVVEHIRKYYVEPANDKELFENAIRGMLSGLDPHSAYLDPQEFTDLKVNTSGKFGGLGLEVTMEDGFVKVISPIDDTPAARAGMLPGDLIIKLDDTPVKGLSLRQAVDLMRGERGSNITLTVIRKGVNKPLQVKVTRDIIRVKSVKKDILDENYAYIRISQFQTRTGEDLVANINQLKEENPGKIKGLILDLRNNPGGTLDSSVKVSDAFLNAPDLKHDKLIVYTEGRLPGSKIREKAHRGDVMDGMPMVVIINGGSASASEIVAGALQDHHRAIVTGTNSFGKGSVQTVLPLKDNHGLKLTTALYYTPSGRSIQATGIVPDIEIKDIKIPEQEEDNSMSPIKEKNLQGHLQNGNGLDYAKTQMSADEPKQPLVIRDYQLHEALNILKGLVLLKNRSR